ncbi:MAG: PAS domain-containing protein [Desulfobacterales bacterium]|nr:PAS domain-containing protein [Desulfobacterales bacterium]
MISANLGKKDNEVCDCLQTFVYQIPNNEVISMNNNIAADTQTDFLVQILDSLPHPLYVIDVNDYTIQYANKEAKLNGMNGYGLNCYAVTHGNAAPCNDRDHICPLTEIKKTKKPVIVEHIHYDKNGRERYIDIHAYPVFNQDGQLVQIVECFLDVSERKIVEEQLRRSQKMEAIGTMTAGIAHEFNNILYIIMGYTEFLLNNDRLTNEDILQEILKASERGSTLIKGLLTFSRKIESECNLHNLNIEIKKITEMLRRIVPKTINIKLDLVDDLVATNVNLEQIGQVLINLALNSKDAMPNGGQITIKSENIIVNESSQYTPLKMEKGQYVLLTFSDTGHGMDTEIKNRIFDPFFTTKEVGKGTGLGLSIVFGIIKNHNGYIFCESEPKIGTTIKIYLPAYD